MPRAGASFGCHHTLITGVDNEQACFSEVGGLTVVCDLDGKYDVRFTTEASADSHLWIDRSSNNTIEHVVPADVDGSQPDSWSLP